MRLVPTASQPTGPWVMAVSELMPAEPNSPGRVTSDQSPPDLIQIAG